MLHSVILHDSSSRRQPNQFTIGLMISIRRAVTLYLSLGAKSSSIAGTCCPRTLVILLSVAHSIQLRLTLATVLHLDTAVHQGFQTATHLVKVSIFSDDAVFSTIVDPGDVFSAHHPVRPHAQEGRRGRGSQ